MFGLLPLPLRLAELAFQSSKSTARLALLRTYQSQAEPSGEQSLSAIETPQNVTTAKPDEVKRVCGRYAHADAHMYGCADIRCRR